MRFESTHTSLTRFLSSHLVTNAKHRNSAALPNVKIEKRAATHVRASVPHAEGEGHHEQRDVQESADEDVTGFTVQHLMMMVMVVTTSRDGGGAEKGVRVSDDEKSNGEQACSHRHHPTRLNSRIVVAQR